MEKIADLKETQKKQEDPEVPNTAKITVPSVPEGKHHLTDEAQDQQAAPSATGVESKIKKEHQQSDKEDKPASRNHLIFGKFFRTVKFTVPSVPERKPFLGNEAQDQQAVCPSVTSAESKVKKEHEQSDKEDKPAARNNFISGKFYHTAKCTVLSIPDWKHLLTDEVQDQQAAPPATGVESKIKKEHEQSDTEDKPAARNNFISGKFYHTAKCTVLSIPEGKQLLTDEAQDQQAAPSATGVESKIKKEHEQSDTEDKPVARNHLISGKFYRTAKFTVPSFPEGKHLLTEEAQDQQAAPSATSVESKIKKEHEQSDKEDKPKVFEPEPIQEDARRKYPIIDQVTKIPSRKMISHIGCANQRLVTPMELPNRAEPVESMFSRFGLRTAAHKKFWPHVETLEEADDPSAIGEFNADRMDSD